MWQDISRAQYHHTKTSDRKPVGTAERGPTITIRLPPADAWLGTPFGFRWEPIDHVVVVVVAVIVVLLLAVVDASLSEVSAPPVPPVDEKRARMWVPACSHATRDRISRARNQRLYLIDQADAAAGSSAGATAPPARRYIVLGSTGNVYTVCIGELVSCTCPDAEKGHVCKHQLFVFLRVLRVT